MKAGSTFSNIAVKNGNGTVIPVTASFSASGWYMYIKINSGYFPDGNYTILLPKGCIADLKGNELVKNYSSNFIVNIL